jgi:hypothetical protein
MAIDDDDVVEWPKNRYHSSFRPNSFPYLCSPFLLFNTNQNVNSNNCGKIDLKPNLPSTSEPLKS